ncbi:MAG TPA: hypothetical protein VLA61_12310 [Ideonella sp.]|uniref:hypothetical protein n=1 Tax=Ideonella sp. TaxID=1929293 RepID=UPI002C0451F8|nr:hypothetical protein [Ideonella sp.]HSI49046.1 hypothetical protein [Ideonella sp.]
MRMDFPALSWTTQASDPARTLLRVDLATPVDAHGAAAVIDTVAGFCAVAGLGAFIDSAAAGPAVCRLLSAEPHPLSLRFELDCNGLDLRSFQVLRNMMAKLREGHIDVQAISVSGAQLRFPSDPDVPLIDEDNEAGAYPQVHGAVRMGRADEDDDIFAGARRCLLVLHAPVTQAHLDALQSILRPWFMLLEAGGYALPLGWPWQLECMGDTAAQFDEKSIEINVLRFRASEEAWSALANMVWVNARELGLPVSHIEIDF